MTNDSVLLYSLIDAPAPPDWLIEHAYQVLNAGSPTQATMNNWGSEYTARSLIKDGENYSNAFNHSCFLNEQSLGWIRDNIGISAKDVRITFTTPGLERCGPHIDRTREFTLMFLLEPGGPDHCTVFYREPGHELIRPKGYHVDDYQSVDEIFKVQQIVNQWNLVNATVLHSVENITQGRRSIQVSFDDVGGLSLKDAVYA